MVLCVVAPPPPPPPPAPGGGGGGGTVVHSRARRACPGGASEPARAMEPIVHTSVQFFLVSKYNSETSHAPSPLRCILRSCVSTGWGRVGVDQVHWQVERQV